MHCSRGSLAANTQYRYQACGLVQYQLEGLYTLQVGDEQVEIKAPRVLTQVSHL